MGMGQGRVRGLERVKGLGLEKVTVMDSVKDLVRDRQGRETVKDSAMVMDLETDLVCCQDRPCLRSGYCRECPRRLLSRRHHLRRRCRCPYHHSHMM